MSLALLPPLFVNFSRWQNSCCPWRQPGLHQRQLHPHACGRGGVFLHVLPGPSALHSNGLLADDLGEQVGRRRHDDAGSRARKDQMPQVLAGAAGDGSGRRRVPAPPGEPAVPAVLPHQSHPHGGEAGEGSVGAGIVGVLFRLCALQTLGSGCGCSQVRLIWSTTWSSHTGPTTACLTAPSSWSASSATWGRCTAEVPSRCTAAPGSAARAFSSAPTSSWASSTTICLWVKAVVLGMVGIRIRIRIRLGLGLGLGLGFGLVERCFRSSLSADQRERHRKRDEASTSRDDSDQGQCQPGDGGSQFKVHTVKATAGPKRSMWPLSLWFQEQYLFCYKVWLEVLQGILQLHGNHWQQESPKTPK